MTRSTDLPAWGRVLVVVAHPDDESFGLGAVIAALVGTGTAVSVLCLTAGEASTLGGRQGKGLSALRAQELAEAARRLGVHDTTLLHFPDGGLADLGPVLAAAVRDTVTAERPDGLLVFGAGGGVTGHPDHEAATTAALLVAREQGLPVLQWCLPAAVTDVLNAELGASFTGYAPADLPIVLTVDREQQRQAIAAHASQAVPGSVLWRRLELLGDHEYLRQTLPDPPRRAAPERESPSGSPGALDPTPR